MSTEEFNAFEGSERKVSPEQDLLSIEGQAASMQESVGDVRAMIANAAENGIELGDDIAGEIEEAEKAAVLAMGAIGSLRASILDKGVRMTQEDTDRYKI